MIPFNNEIYFFLFILPFSYKDNNSTLIASFVETSPPIVSFNSIYFISLAFLTKSVILSVSVTEVIISVVL